MECYECRKQGIARVAVATCRSCSAGLCLEHVRETALRMQNGSLAPSCHHDTWVPYARIVRDLGREHRAVAA